MNIKKDFENLGEKLALELNKEKITEWMQSNRREYKKYLSSLNIEGKRIASVDMTTGQFTSQKLLSSVFDNRYILGFFSITCLKNPKIKYITYSNEYFTSSMTNLINFMELLITAPEPPIKNLVNAKPVYSTINLKEQERLNIISELQKGIINFTQDYLSVFRNIPVDFSFNTVANLLNKHIQNMTFYDKYMFKNIYHASDAANKKYENIFKL